MFGGLAFLYRDNVAVRISSDDLMARVGRDTTGVAPARQARASST